MIELATRRVEIAGITPNRYENWMVRIGRNLTDPIEGFLAEKKLLILDRDSTPYVSSGRSRMNVSIG